MFTGEKNDVPKDTETDIMNPCHRIRNTKDTRRQVQQLSLNNTSSQFVRQNISQLRDLFCQNRECIENFFRQFFGSRVEKRKK